MLAGEHDLLGAAERRLADDALCAAGARKSPSVISGKPRRAVSARIRMWGSRVSSVPPPSTKPFTAAMVGLSEISMRRKTRCADLGEFAIMWADRRAS